MQAPRNLGELTSRVTGEKEAHKPPHFYETVCEDPLDPSPPDVYIKSRESMPSHREIDSNTNQNQHSEGWWAL